LKNNKKIISISQTRNIPSPVWRGETENECFYLELDKNNQRIYFGTGDCEISCLKNVISYDLLGDFELQKVLEALEFMTPSGFLDN